MFGFKKEDKEKAKKQYNELLNSIGKKNDNCEGFVLGEQKTIYNKELSLDDIISNNNK